MTTAQEVYNNALFGIRRQGGYSGEAVDNLFGCLYRAPNGRKCAAGHNITDDEYHPRMEGYSVKGTDLPERLRRHEDFLYSLQLAHDNAAQRGESMDEWEARMEALAQKYGLVYTPKEV